MGEKRIWTYNWEFEKKTRESSMYPKEKQVRIVKKKQKKLKIQIKRNNKWGSVFLK